jgi:hypothetical protein
LVSETRRSWSIALRRRCACQTIAANIAAINGTSVSSSGLWPARDTS